MKRSPLLVLLITLGCVTATPGDPAADRLEMSPRHAEWVQIDRDGRALHAYVTYPETRDRAPAVLVIHENRGLTGFEQSVADRLAENGFIAIAPDMLSGMAPGGGRASDFPTTDAAREGISKLPREQVMGDLDAAADYVLSLPAANGTLSVAGFCWGGSRTWQFANSRAGLRRAFPFYGTGPQEPEGVAGITAPVHAFYGGDDARVNATIPKTEELMRAAGKAFDPVIYDGAGHAFMRSGDAPDASEANRAAYQQAWQRWLALLRS